MALPLPQKAVELPSTDRFLALIIKNRMPDSSIAMMIEDEAATSLIAMSPVFMKVEELLSWSL